MKRNIFIILLLSLSLEVAWADPTAAVQKEKKEKSEAELFMQSVSRIKSAEIDYAYISTSMFKQMFTLLDGNVTLNNIGSVTNVGNVFLSIKSMRQFVTTGEQGYTLLSKKMEKFMLGDETVMGMELMAENMTDDVHMIVYSDNRNVLMIQDDGGETMEVVFIVGLPYKAFVEMMEKGIDFRF